MLSLLAVTLLCAEPPTQLANRRFYDSADVADFKDGGLDPFKWFSNRPPSLFFDRPGHVVIGFGQEDVSCDVTADKSGGWVATCSGAPHPMKWEWTTAGRARTNLFGLFRADATLLEVAELNQTSEQLHAAADAKFSKRVLPSYAGVWADDAGARVTVDARARFWECLDGCDEASVRTVCLERKPDLPSLMALSTDAGVRLVDAYVEGLCGGGPALERKPNGRTLRRLTPAEATNKSAHGR